MATACTHTTSHYTRTSKSSWPGVDRSRPKTPSSSNFEVIDGMLYRRKLEKGFINYREVLDEARRQEAVTSFHRRRPGQRHLTLEDTYKCVAENYWWEGMYFQIRDVVLGCTECRNQKRKKNQEHGTKVCVTKRIASHSHDVLGRLKSQREAGMFCDITLRTNGRSYTAHKAVLAAVSDHFQEIFTEMDNSVTADIDFTGFSEQSLLSLLDFSYSSTLKVRSEDLPEVITMARHLGMWRAVEACSALMKEQNPDCHPGQDFSVSCPVSCHDRHQQQNKRKGLQGSGQDTYRSLQLKMDTSSESLHPSPRRNLRRLTSPQVPVSPSHRMKLLDFKSPSLKKDTSLQNAPPTQSSPISPSNTRILRSSPGAARKILESMPESPRQQKKPHPISELSCSPRRRPSVGCSPVRVKQEEVVLDDELDYARAQEKYKLMNVLGLQRTALLPRPEDLIGWRQKKRLRKLKANNYSLTKRRKPQPASCDEPYGMLGFPLCHPNTLLLNKSVMNKATKAQVTPVKRKSLAVKKVPPSDRSMRSKGVLPDLFQLVSRAGYSGRELRRSVRKGDHHLVKQHARRKTHKPPVRNMVKIKAEPADYSISGLSPMKLPQSPTTRAMSNVALETVKTLRYNSSRPSTKSRVRRDRGKGVKQVGSQALTEAKEAGLKVPEPTPEHSPSIYDHPLYKVIKEEPVDPLPVGIPFPDPPSPDLGKRQSKPPIKLLDSGFLFSFCRPVGAPIAGLKKEEESVDICLTRSVSQMGEKLVAESTHRTLRNRSLPLPMAVVKREKEERSLNPNVRVRSKAKLKSSSIPLAKDSAAKTRRKGSPHPASSRALVMLDSVRRARLKQLRGPRSQVPKGSKSAHNCLQCPTSHRDCDALMMHRLRHIEGKHWPCLLCSKTFFRLGNVRNHIRTHDPKLYKCRSCILASS